jgi:peptide/nickel transport system permease protein
LMQAVFIILCTTILIFFMMRMLPGDPILMMLTKNQAAQYTQEQLAALRHEFGMDKPLITQYVNWLSSLIFHGDLGISIGYRSKVASELARAFPISLNIGLPALAIGFLLGVPAGIISAVRRGKWADTAVTILANIGMTIPVFWMGIILMYLIALKLQLLPIFGYVSPTKDFWDSTRHIILPVFCLAIWPCAAMARQMRSSMLEVMRQDYVRTAWSKGLPERMVISRHAARNALIPVVTVLGIFVANIIAGEVLVEQVFTIPGAGRLIVQSVLLKDYPIIQGVTLVIAGSVILINLVTDITVAWIDPRIRLQ